MRSIGGKVQVIDYYEHLSPQEILYALTSRSELQDKHSNIVSTKANTLLTLKEQLRFSSIEDILIITVKQAKENPANVARIIKERFTNKKIVVRSSSVKEDSFESSNAGHFESVLGIQPDDSEAVLAAIQEVYNSYSKDGFVDEEEQILIQTQTENVRYSGVVFTRDIQQNRPYYIINYDDSGSTDSVTSGASGKSIYIAQDASIEAIPVQWQNLYRAIKELEGILTKMLLDIEFAITKDDRVFIFQVRPLAASYKFGRISDTQSLLQIKNTYKEGYKKCSIQNKTSLLSDMAF